MKLLTALIFFTLNLSAMPLHRVILSTDTNPTYVDFWPMAAKAWEEVVGVRPTLALIAPEEYEIDESVGDVLRFTPIEGIPTSFQAQVIRLLLPAYFPDEGCLISDIDLFPMQKEYFTDSIESCSGDAFVVFRDKAYEGANIPHYPMCYLAGKGKSFQKLFDLKAVEEIQEKIKEWFSLHWGWGTDERVVYQAVNEKRFEMPIRLLGHKVTKRIDRSNWFYEKELIPEGHYIDAHLLRPYKKYMRKINSLFSDLGLASPFEQNQVSLVQPVNQWQYYDETGQVLPFFTKPFLDELEKWDMSNWNVFEYGSGYSTIWLAKRCKNLVSVEHDSKWFLSVQKNLVSLGLENVDYRLMGAEYFSNASGEYVSDFIATIDDEDTMYDCVIIDSGTPEVSKDRNACVKRALNHIKPGGILILNNVNQATGGIDSSPSLQFLSEYEHYCFDQPALTDWRTDYFVIGKPAQKKKKMLTSQKNQTMVDDLSYGTHVTPLLTAVIHTSGPVLEMGCGDFSTPLLSSICSKEKRFLLSTDTGRKWINRFRDLECGYHQFQYVPCFDNDWDLNPKPHLWDSVGKDMPRWGVVFIDHRPGERRVKDIERVRNQADIIVVHDTQAPSYGYEPTLSTFKYRYIYERYPTQTTLVSDTIDVEALFD